MKKSYPVTSVIAAALLAAALLAPQGSTAQHNELADAARELGTLVPLAEPGERAPRTPRGAARPQSTAAAGSAALLGLGFSSPGVSQVQRTWANTRMRQQQDQWRMQERLRWQQQQSQRALDQIRFRQSQQLARTHYRLQDISRDSAATLQRIQHDVQIRQLRSASARSAQGIIAGQQLRSVGRIARDTSKWIPHPGARLGHATYKLLRRDDSLILDGAQSSFRIAAHVAPKELQTVRALGAFGGKSIGYYKNAKRISDIRSYFDDLARPRTVSTGSAYRYASPSSATLGTIASHYRRMDRSPFRTGYGVSDRLQTTHQLRSTTRIVTPADFQRRL
jgi:hypothetical protein